MLPVDVQHVLQWSSFDKISETAMLFADLRVRYERTLLKDRTLKKKKSRTKQMKCADQKKDRLPKVIPRVFTILGASLIERLSTGALFPPS